MESFFKKILEERGSIDLGKSPEEVIEERENLKGIFDKILENLDDLENKNNVDKIVGQNSASELREDIQIAKDILEKTGLLATRHSNGKEILRNIETSFSSFLRKAKEKSAERYADVIKEDYEKLKKFFDLILECKEFREKEFGNESGYLTEEENASGGANFRLDIEKYLKKCEEKIRQRNN